jgi:hypothetical protein
VAGLWRACCGCRTDVLVLREIEFYWHDTLIRVVYRRRIAGTPVDFGGAGRE